MVLVVAVSNRGVDAGLLQNTRSRNVNAAGGPVVSDDAEVVVVARLRTQLLARGVAPGGRVVNVPRLKILFVSATDVVIKAAAWSMHADPRDMSVSVPGIVGDTGTDRPVSVDIVWIDLGARPLSRCGACHHGEG